MRIRAFIKRIGYAAKSVFWKRNKKIILFGSWYGEKFADNTRFLYQYLFENKEKLGLERVVWVTRSDDVFNTMHEMGYEVYMMDSAESIHYHKVAGYHIICNASGECNEKGDILGEYSYGAIRINLWHGLGNKRTGKLSNQLSAASDSFKNKMNTWLSKHSLFYKSFYCRDGGWANCYYLVPTDLMANVFKKAYLIDDKHIITSGYPRNCPVPQLTKEEERIIQSIKQHRYKVLYLPTFRQENSFCCSDTAKEIKSYLEKKDILWLQKLHSADKNNALDFISENIINLDTNFDINVLLNQVDIIITDYSSVFSDALYHDKPIIFYTPDFDDYCKGMNGLIFEPELVMRGLFSFSITELESCLEEYLGNPESAFDEKYNNAKQLYWGQTYQFSDIWKMIVKTCK